MLEHKPLTSTNVMIDWTLSVYSSSGVYFSVPTHARYRDSHKNQCDTSSDVVVVVLQIPRLTYLLYLYFYHLEWRVTAQF